MTSTNRSASYLVISLLVTAVAAWGAEFRSAWPKGVERVWVGPEYWANPLQDWRISRGRLECLASGANRNVNLLTHQLSGASSEFSMRVRLGRIHAGDEKLDSGWAGFRIGIQGRLSDYRDSALRGAGLNAGITTSGKPFIGDEEAYRAHLRRDMGAPVDDLELRLSAVPSGEGYRLTLAVHDPRSGDKLRETTSDGLPPDQLVGNVALVSDYAPELKPSNQDIYARETNQRAGNVRFWFSDWQVSGGKIESHEDQTFGPILFAQHTLSRGVLKMTAQMPPIGQQDTPAVRLQIRDANSDTWKTVDEEYIHTLARTATFRVPNWDSTRNIQYRLAYALIGSDGRTADHYWTGTVRREPVEKDTVVVAAFTGNQDTGFPNTRTVKNVRFHDPDVMVFTGDQIYENVAGYGIQREPVETAALDYLRKWYLLGWSFGDLMRDRVTVSMPDDHDVYQGNIWGGGGRKVTLAKHASGGYVMPAEWVNMVQRTQTSHLPDPYDPRPIDQGIGVYFSELNYGRISFAILEDRKFKSGPEDLTPPTGGRPDHITDPNFDPQAYDVAGATLLGERQLKFVRDWAADWRGADMKVSLTQTIFINAATTHGAEMMRLVADLDANGWPQSGRSRALKELRKGFTFMIGGDQHLPSIIHQGIDDWNDAGYSFSVPSVAAGYPRAWEPLKPGNHRQPGMPDYTGEYKDGLGNRMTVWAVANPKKVLPDAPLEMLHDKASGYGIVRLHKTTGKITIECWPLLIDPSDPRTGGQFPGWPKTINVEDNYGRKAEAYLPTIQVSGLANPVVQVVDEAGGEIVYTLRIRGTSFRPKVFKAGAYTVRVGEPGTHAMKVFRNVQAQSETEARTLQVTF